MIQQTILPFKMERTDELITPRSGLAMFSEVVRTLGVPGKIEAAFPRPGSNRGYEAWSYIEPLVLMLARLFAVTSTIICWALMPVAAVENALNMENHSFDRFSWPRPMPG